MDNIRHIHEVLEILAARDNHYTVQSLRTDLEERFGEDASFINCAEYVFGLTEVVPFLVSKNKIRLEGEEIIPLMLSCDH
ncbi:MAG: DUF2492 family protein [Cyclobacteriaceae bacterium]|nr:DUF2492 family protein [Cyclobacteriaceae bacterium]